MVSSPEIPGCKIVDKLGEGGASTVYLGIQEKLNRKVAIKVLDPRLLTNKSTAARFKREAKTAAMLSHTNIVQIYDTGKAGHFHYIVMEYLRESLKDRMQKNPNNKVHPQMALDITETIMKALGHAHFKGVYHRDIKPDNIMFRQDSAPVLTDFGIAHMLNSDLQLTRSGTIIGSVEYMSPEQCKALKDIDGRADIYSLGTVLFEMLTGKKPYQAKSDITIALQHIEGPIPILPREVFIYQPLIERMMAKDRKKRLSSFLEFSKELDKIQINQTPSPTPAQHQSIQAQTEPASNLLKESPKITPLRKSGRPSTLKNYKHRKRIIIMIIPFLFIVLLGKIILFTGNSNIKTENRETPGINDIQEIAFRKTFEKVNEHFPIVIETDGSIIQRDLKYDLYLINAENSLTKKKYEEAKEFITKAKKIKKTPKSDELEKEINITYFNNLKQLVAEGAWEKFSQEDDKAFEQAKIENTIKSYEKYIDRFPKGQYVKEAKSNSQKLLKELELESKRKQKVTLRSNYRETLDRQSAQALIKDHDFFEKNLNENGRYKSYYEKIKKNKASLVIDYTTGLMWYNGNPAEKAMNLKEAEKWLENLNRIKYGGYDDWRFPSLEEAASLLRKQKTKRDWHIDPIFSGNQSMIWTKDRFSSNGTWAVYFYSGIAKVARNNSKLYIRPVRTIKDEENIN